MPAYGPTASYPIMAPEQLTPSTPPASGGGQRDLLTLGTIQSTAISPDPALGGRGSS